MRQANDNQEMFFYLTKKLLREFTINYIGCLFSSVVEHFTCNEKVLGSIPKGGLVFLYLCEYKNK